MLFSHSVAQGRFAVHKSLWLLSVVWIFSTSHHLFLLAYKNQPWSPFYLLLGPALYLIASPTVSNSLSRRLVHLLPFVLAMIAMIAGFDPSTLAIQKQYLFISLAPLPYLFAVIKNFPRANTQGIDKDPIIFTTIAFAFSCAWYLLMAFVDEQLHVALILDLRVFPIGGMVMATLGFWNLNRAVGRQIQTIPIDLREEVPIRYQRTAIQQDQLVGYLQLIENYLVSSQQYLDPLITPQQLANSLNIPKHLISWIFNEHIGYRFHTYIAILRVEHAKKLIASGSSQHKIEALAEQCGFNSSTSFYRHFRQQTGISPYRYICQEGSAAK